MNDQSEKDGLESHFEKIKVDGEDDIDVKRVSAY
jgi:hypothetical protein